MQIQKIKRCMRKRLITWTIVIIFRKAYYTVKSTSNLWESFLRENRGTRERPREIGKNQTLLFFPTASGRGYNLNRR